MKQETLYANVSVKGLTQLKAMIATVSFIADKLEEALCDLAKTQITVEIGVEDDYSPAIAGVDFAGSLDALERLGIERDLNAD